MFFESHAYYSLQTLPNICFILLFCNPKGFNQSGNRSELFSEKLGINIGLLVIQAPFLPETNTAVRNISGLVSMAEKEHKIFQYFLKQFTVTYN